MKTPEEWQARLGLLIKLGRVTSNEVALFQAAMLEAWERGVQHGYWAAHKQQGLWCDPKDIVALQAQPPPELTKKGATDE